MRHSVIAAVVLGLTAATADAALLGRLPVTPSGTDYQAYYDDVLNITWLADANLAKSQTFGLPRPLDIPRDSARSRRTAE